MISTVTTTTVTTVTTGALAASLSLLVIVGLLIFLIQKEILSGATSARARAFSRVLNIAVLPLLISFAFVAFVKVAEALR